VIPKRLLKTHDEAMRFMQSPVVVEMFTAGACEITVAKPKSKKSQAQLGLLWGVWYPVLINHIAECTGVLTNSDDLHEAMVKKLCGVEVKEERDVPMMEGGSWVIVKTGRVRTSKFSTSEMAKYLTLLDMHCADAMGLLLPRTSDYEMAVYGTRRKAA
jgi:hypothetical protein